MSGSQLRGSGNRHRMDGRQTGVSAAKGVSAQWLPTRFGSLCVVSTVMMRCCTSNVAASRFSARPVGTKHRVGRFGRRKSCRRKLNQRRWCNCRSSITGASRSYHHIEHKKRVARTARPRIRFHKGPGRCLALLLYARWIIPACPRQMFH